MDWSNVVCKDYSDVLECIDSNQQVQAMNNYGIAFLGKYLKNKDTDEQLQQQVVILDGYQYEF